MLELSRYALAAGTGVLVLAFLLSSAALFMRAKARPTAAVQQPAMAGGAASAYPSSPISPVTPPATQAPTKPKGVGWASVLAVYSGFALLTVAQIARAIGTGRAPHANQYEFACSFAWGMTAALVFFLWRYKVEALAAPVLVAIISILLYAFTVNSEALPLMPALHNHVLLTIHVFCAVLGYGAAAVAFGAAVLYLTHPWITSRLRIRGLPSRDLLDEIGYRAVVVTFPLLTGLLILGAIWADIAWGRYWSWDPKETAAFVTWLIYGVYLHARIVRDWRGSRAAWVLIVGFAAILFTYYGNLFFGGLHAYA